MADSSDETFFTPSVTAFIIMFVFIAVYAAYVWYMGRNTVPVPSYMIGFRDVPVPGGDKPAKGIMQDALEASEFFENPPGLNKEEEKAKATGPIAEGFYGGAARGAGPHNSIAFLDPSGMSRGPRSAARFGRAT